MNLLYYVSVLDAVFRIVIVFLNTEWNLIASGNLRR